MTKKALSLLVLSYSFSLWPGIAGAVDVQPGVIKQDAPSAAAAGKQSIAVGPCDPEKVTSQGFGLDLLLSRNFALTGALSLLPPQPYLASGQVNNAGSVSTSQVSGAIGLKLSFD